VLLATEAPVLLVPAMNDRMWAHPQTARNAAHLRELGYRVVDPDTGRLAAGEGQGPGRMPEPETIFAHAGRLLEPPTWRGRRIVVTAGPTREPVDPVRFLSNRSSGKMGVALASAAWRRGADVVLVAGPLDVPTPMGPQLVAVETTDEMACAVKTALVHADALIMAAAPADFRPAEPAAGKIKKSRAPEAIALAPTADILVESRALRDDGLITVGFALETDDVIANGRAKLEAKHIDLIVANDALEPGAGFAVDTNRVALIARHGAVEELPLMTKAEVADVILDRVEALFGER